MIVKGFRAAEISEAIENAQDNTEKVENHFKVLKLYLVFLTLVFFKAKIEKVKVLL